MGLFNTTTGKAVSRGIFADIGDAKEVTLLTDTIIDATDSSTKNTKNYTLRLWIHDDGAAQDSLMGQSLKAKVKVTGEAVEYTDESCFTFDESTGKISDYDRTTCGIDVVIPNTINGVTVSTVELDVFLDVNSLIFPNTVTTFSSEYENGFSVNSNSITIPESVTSIPSNTFRVFAYAEYGHEYKQLFIPDINMDGFSFGGHNEIESLVIPTGVKTLNGFGSNASLKHIVIPNTVTTIKPSAFRYLTNVKEIELPSSFNTIEWELSNTSFDLPFLNSSVETIIVRNSSIPSGLPDNWNCLAVDEVNYELVCTKYATVLLQP